MKPPWSGFAALGFVLFWGQAPEVSAQTTPPTAASGRVMLAVVVDPNGRPSVDVGVDDFVIEEGNDDREILAVRVADYPVAVLVDNGSDSQAALAAMRGAAARFITRIGQRPVALGTLAEPANIVAAFEDDREHVLERLAALGPAPTRTLTPLAAVTRVAEMIRETGRPFSAVVIIAARPVDPSEQAASGRYGPIIDTGAAVHVVALRRPGVQPESTADLLRELAGQTRGQHISIYTEASYPAALDRLADRLSTEVLIDYLVPSGSIAREVRVGVKIPGFRATALGVTR